MWHRRAYKSSSFMASYNGADKYNIISMAFLISFDENILSSNVKMKYSASESTYLRVCHSAVE